MNNQQYDAQGNPLPEPNGVQNRPGGSGRLGVAAEYRRAAVMPAQQQPALRSADMHYGKEDQVGEIRTTDPNGKFKTTGDIVTDELQRHDVLPIEPIDPVLDGTFKINGWTNPQPKPLPKYYPLERSTVKVTLQGGTVETVTYDIAKCARAMSLQAKYFDDPASGAFKSRDNIEVYLALWISRDGSELIIEAQRRRGDTLSFHRYSQCLLDAALGKFSPSEYQGSFVSDLDIQYLKEAERMLQGETMRKPEEDDADSMDALRVVDGLFKQERMDLKLRGLESLTVLVDPRRTGIATAVRVSHVILLGLAPGRAPGETEKLRATEIRKFVLSVIKEYTSISGDPAAAPVENHAMDCEYDSDEDNFFDDIDDMSKPRHERDAMSQMLSSALFIVTCAVEVMGTLGIVDPDNADLTRNQQDVAAAFLSYASDVCGESFFSVLFGVLGRAEKNPHNACLAAKCLRYLLNATDRPIESKDESTKLKSALSIGSLCHANLEGECNKLVRMQM